MKTRTKYIIPAGLALMILAGCSNESSEPNTGSQKYAVQVSASIDDVQSRAYDTQWETGDKIGVSDKNFTNSCYVTNNGNSSFTALTTDDIIYYLDNNNDVLTAYYPWNANSVAINGDTRKQNEQKTFDYLWAQATGHKDTPAVDFNFSHKMAKVILRLTPGEAVSLEEVQNAVLSISGMVHEGSFDVTDGSTRLKSGSDTGDWTFSSVTPVTTSGNYVVYSMILYPQSFNTLPVFSAKFPDTVLKAGLDFTSANRRIDGAQAKNELITGRQYTLDITLKRTAIELNNCRITAWIDVAGDALAD